MKRVVLVLALLSGVVVNAQVQCKYCITSTINGVSISYTETELNHFRDSINKINIDTLQNRFIKQLNIYRVSKSLPLVIFNTNAYAASKFIANYNDINRDKLTHITNVAGYETLLNRRAKFNIPAVAIGENLQTNSIEFSFFFFKTEKLTYEQSILKAWIHSKGHNANLLHPGTNIGFNIINHKNSNGNIDEIIAMVIY